MNVSRTTRQRSLALTAAAILAAFASGTSLAEIPASLTPLVAKDVHFKTEKDGTITEVSTGPKSEITLEGYRAIGALRTLKRANISPETGRLDDETAAALAGLDQLEKFFANGAELSDNGFKAFAGWKSLQSFGLDHWGWNLPGHLPQKGTLGPGLAYLAACPNLEQVRLGGCRVDNRVTEALAQIKSLQSVDLQHTFAVTDEGIAALKALPKLHIVKLSPGFSPRITDATLVSLGDIKTLEEINIGETWLTYDKGFARLKNLPSLKKIVLTKVIADEADIAKLKADHPTADIQWTQPDEATTAKTKADFQRFWDKQSKPKP
jgi:hypothetical protein